MIIDSQRYCITLDDAALMPDGRFYKVIWGTCYVHKFEDTFGFKPRGHADYYYTVGNGGIVVAGCRVNNGFPSPEPPINLMTNHVVGLSKDGKPIDFYYECIFFADKI